ncbi:MAG: peptidoglycan DD-metalloendopeptidase family protein [Clostridia bacterium]|nr:peptidoglycan DD-metalloendopeptidase family protein [Clostridia bacterium]
MNRRITKWVAKLLILSFSMVYVLSFSISAAPSKSKVQQDIQAIQAQKSEILKQAEQKETDISELQQEINTLQFDIDQYGVKIAQSQKELDAAKEKEKKQRETMKLRLRVMYEDNNTTYLNLILSGGSLTDILSRIEIIRQMSDYDRNMVENLKKLQLEIAYKKEELEKEQQTLTERKAAIEEKKATLVAEKAALDGLIAKLGAQESAKFAELRRIEEEERAMQALIQAQGSHSATSQIVGNGKFGYPTGNTTITSPYGYRIHPIYGTRKLHAGIDLPASTGSPIYATADGKVITAGWVSGYGNTVIIDHGGGVTSLYAHNTSLNVSVGQTVKRGARIASAGSTGNSTGPHCHFEIRLNGSPVNPMNYLR